MELWLRATVVVCLAVLMTWNGAVADEERAVNNACTYFYAIDNNGDLYATYFDYLCEWFRVPLTGGDGKLRVRDVTRQMDILIQFLKQFPLTDRNFILSLLRGGIGMEEFLAVVKAKRYTDFFRKQIRAFVDFLFDALTYDGDKKVVNLDEFKLLYSVFNLKGAETAFSNLDLNGDGYITRNEAYPALEDYFIEAKDPRNANLIGPPRTCEEVRKRVRTWPDPIADRKLVLLTEDYGNLNSLIKFLRTVDGLSDLLPGLLEELLRLVLAPLA